MQYRPSAAAAHAAAASLCLAMTLVLTPGTAPAGPYTFRNVFDTTGRFLSFHQDPALNNAGTVALTAVTPDGGNRLLRVSADGSVVQLDAVGNLGFLGEPSINDAGAVAFNKRDPVLDHESLVIDDGTPGGRVVL